MLDTLNRRRSLVGQLIVAMPHLDDTPFEKAIALICSHDEHHAFGIVVNKPMEEVSVSDVVSEMQIPTCDDTHDMPVRFGGPVSLERGAVLHTDDYHEGDTVQVSQGIRLTATKDALAALCDLRRRPQTAALIMGHAGWSAGQLENEIKRNDWLSLPAKPEHVFGANEESWSNVLLELGITDLSLLDGNETLVARPN